MNNANRPSSALIELAAILLQFEVERIAAAADETLARDAATAADAQSTEADRLTKNTPGRSAGQGKGVR